MSPHAVYLLAPIGVGGALEAEGVEHWACCREHAEQLTGNDPARAELIAPDFNFEDGTICEVCGVVLGAQS